MMSEKQFIDSQNECASMLGMTLCEYQKYCKGLKVPTQDDISEEHSGYDTNDILDFLGMDEIMLNK